MIRSVQNRNDGLRRRLGQSVATFAAINPINAGISAGVSLASTAITNWMNSIQLSHDADTATTLIVNGLGAQLENLDQAYLAEPNPTCADQRAALNAYDQAWQWLQSSAACGNPAYGAAGNRCISDRAPTGPYPWQTYYRNPIANDPRVASLECDTSESVLLPSLSTGQYSDTGITSGAGSSSTGQTAAQIAAAAVQAAAATSANPTTPTTSAAASLSTTPAGVAVPSLTISPTYLLIAALGIAALFLSGGDK